MDKLDIPIEDLVLDLSNPRLVEVSTQAEALRALVEFGPAFFKNLMTSIRLHKLDPGDSFYVLEDSTDPNDYVVVDGNRRLAALKVLNEPALLKNIGLSEADVALLTKAVGDYQPGLISSVECVLFDARSEADDWIERRHGKDLAGEGRLTWGPLEIERFQRDHSNLDVISFVEQNTSMDAARWADVKKAVENNSSSLNRFLSNKALRQLIGLTVTTETDDSKIPYFTGTADKVLCVLEQIFTDIHEKRINSRSYNSAEEIEGYIERLPAELRQVTKSTSSPLRFRDVVIKKPEVEPDKKDKSPTDKGDDKTTRAKRPRLQLAEKKHPFQQPETTKGQRLVYEASNLNARDFPLASAYILRAFLEHTIDTYMNAHGIPRVEAGRSLELNKRAELVIDHLIRTKVVSNGQELRGARRVLTDTQNASSIQALNDYHHDRYQMPSAEALRNAWDACLPLYCAVYGSAKS